MQKPSDKDLRNTPVTVIEYIDYLEDVIHSMKVSFYVSLNARNMYIEALSAENEAVMKLIYNPKKEK